MGELLILLFGFFSGGIVLYFFLRANPKTEIKIDKVVDVIVGFFKKVINKLKKK
jgi:hypothetical protein